MSNASTRERFRAAARFHPIDRLPRFEVLRRCPQMRRAVEARR
jgi:hypothetical protein